LARELGKHPNMAARRHWGKVENKVSSFAPFLFKKKKKKTKKEVKRRGL
jgi:hypothetical protein